MNYDIAYVTLKSTFLTSLGNHSPFIQNVNVKFAFYFLTQYIHDYNGFFYPKRKRFEILIGRLDSLHVFWKVFKIITDFMIQSVDFL